MTEFGNFEKDQEDKQQLENWASEKETSVYPGNCQESLRFTHERKLSKAAA